MIFTYLAIIILLLLIGFYIYQIRLYSYWRHRNVKYLEPNLVFGNLLPLLTKQKSIGELLKEVHLSHPNEPHVGLFFGGNPCLVIRDYEVCKRILLEDKKYFASRILRIDEKRDPTQHYTLFNLNGEKWAEARKGMTPGFTSLSLKIYLKRLLPIANELNELIVKSQPNKVNATTLVWNFTVDCIARGLFGFNGNAMQDPNDEMLRITKQIFSTDLKSSIARLLFIAAPQIYYLSRLYAFHPDGSKNLNKLTWAVIRMREENNIEEKDLMGQLMAVRKQAMQNPEKKTVLDWNGFGLAGQVMASVRAGTDTLSSVIICFLYELAKHPEIQDKVRKEVNEVYPDGVITADNDRLMSMKYVTMVINEALRLHPSLPFLDRLCTAEYQIPGTNTKIDPGVYVFVPMWGLQTDPEHWDNPTEFIPERFSDPEVTNNKPFLPFSYGPKICIGMRFVIIQMRLFLASLVLKWRWQLPSDSPVFKRNTFNFINQFDKNLLLDFEPL